MGRKWYFEKKRVGRAMGNETIYWGGLRASFGWAYERGGRSLLSG